MAQTSALPRDESIRYTAIPLDLTRRKRVRWSKLTQLEEQEHENLDLKGLLVEFDGIVQVLRKPKKMLVKVCSLRSILESKL